MDAQHKKTNGGRRRRDAREQAFQLLFAKTINDEPMQELIEAAEESGETTIDAYASGLVLLAEENAESIDAIIAQHLRGWTLQRLSKVTLALLRLSVCEICFLKKEDVPVSVSINEAVELAKQYGNEKDAAYINGVLASVAKMQEGGEHA